MKGMNNSFESCKSESKDQMGGGWIFNACDRTRIGQGKKHEINWEGGLFFVSELTFERRDGWNV